MADDKTFTLVGKFDDKITPSLRKLDTSLKSLSKSFEKMQRGLRPISKDLGVMAAAAQRVGDSFSNQRSSLDNTVRGLTQYRKEMGKVVSAQEKLSKRVKMPVFNGGGGGGGGGRPGGGGGGGGRPRPMPMDMGGDGYTIDKGIIAGLATNMITGIFDQIGNAVGKAVNFVKNGLQERIDDEMGDIQSAGGILSVGKEFKVPWADTYQEAFSIQKRLNGEMSKLAAALPGETGQYVSNMKQVTDTVMKVTMSNGPAMIKSMQGFNSSVKTSQDAYVEATKQLAKYTTLASMGQTGGVPLTALAEQMLNSDKVNVKSLKRTFAALEKNPLVSGAFEKYEAEMNKAGAGSAERYTAMIKAFEQAFPVEVLDAMTNSAEGIIQGLKSGILDPETGILGLGKAFEVDFAGLNRKMGPMKESLSVFDMFLGMFKAVGMLLGPIVSELPSLISPFSSLVNPLREFYVMAENTISNFKGATKMFGDMKLDFAPFRGSLMAIGKLAKALGADEGEFTKLEGMLSGKKLDFGGALQQAIKVLFSSDALEKFGKAVGESLGGFLSMLAGLAEKGGELVDQSGLVSGFMTGWRGAKGSEAIATIVRKLVETIVKGVLGLGWESLKTDPIGTAVLATVFLPPVQNAVFGFFGRLATGIAAQMAAANVSGFVAGWLPAIIGSISTWITGTLVPFIAAAAAPVAIIVAVLAVVYIFRDQIIGFFDWLSGWVAQNIEGPLGEVLMGVIEVWKGIINAIHGIIDFVIGFVTGDKAKMAAAWSEIQAAFGQIWNGIKLIATNFIGAISQVGPMLARAAMSGITALAGAITNGIGMAARKVAEMLGISVSAPPGTKLPPGFTLPSATRPGYPAPAPAPGRRTATPAASSKKGELSAFGFANGSENPFSGTLGQAINHEMANKPPGSDLVIANSSETIIPAFNGLNLDSIAARPAANGLNGGMEGVINATYTAAQHTAAAFSMGFQSFAQRLQTGQQATVAAINKGTQVSATQNAAMMAKLSAQNASLMTKMNAVAAAAGNAGGGGAGGAGGGMALGGGYGGKGSAIAGALGTYIKQTGGAPGSIHEHPQHGGVRGRHSKNSYHYQGRAIDIGAYAYEQGPVLKRIAAFNSKMGVKPVELLKAGDPGHSDHVHVAYALGAGNPAFFNSENAADQWETMMAPKSPIVSSVRARANEMKGGGGAMTVNAPITINAQPGQDTDQLAAVVAQKLTQAINQLRYSNYNV